MAIPTSPLPVCRFAGLLACREDQLVATRFELAQWYGPIDDVSDVLPFTHSSTYDADMGKNLVRQWVRFHALFTPEHLPKCKLETNMAETLLARQFADKGKCPQRPVNIDPGYLSRTKVILATTLDAPHRAYIAEGIYADVILQHDQGKWSPFPWTYPDYQSPQAAAFFDRARTAYLQQLAKAAGGQ